jgi:hypothetical protein
MSNLCFRFGKEFSGFLVVPARVNIDPRPLFPVMVRLDV